MASLKQWCLMNFPLALLGGVFLWPNILGFRGCSRAISQGKSISASEIRTAYSPDCTHSYYFHHPTRRMQVCSNDSNECTTRLAQAHTRKHAHVHTHAQTHAKWLCAKHVALLLARWAARARTPGSLYAHACSLSRASTLVRLPLPSVLIVTILGQLVERSVREVGLLHYCCCPGVICFE